jgi:hypothetical protein
MAISYNFFNIYIDDSVKMAGQKQHIIINSAMLTSHCIKIVIQLHTGKLKSNLLK